MISINEVTLLGRLTRDPEIRYSQKGFAVGILSVACNRRWKSRQGEAQEETTYVDVTCFGKVAEIVGESCRKGSPILVKGRLTNDQWEDKKTGATRSKLKVTADTCQAMEAQAPQPVSSAPRSRQAPQPSQSSLIDDDDVPF